MKMANNNEISKRRTFAIISHPDAGKTTLTEKLLLFGGAIHVAGAVKSNKIKKTATSDWMEIEKQRGISVATSVMGFNYGDYKINILDTPGHQDFAEDTYRTLTAVDSVIIVVDVAKGVETQTRKLMEVCRMRNTPVIIFVNKLDREGRDPFDILDELEKELQISVRPLSWPINIGAKFKGVYNIYEHTLNLFKPDKQHVTDRVEINDINDPAIDAAVGEDDAAKLRADIELIDGVYPEFDEQDYLDAMVAPVFFGHLGLLLPKNAWSTPKKKSSQALCSRFMPTWTPITAAASPLSRYARAYFAATRTTSSCAVARLIVSRPQRHLWHRKRRSSMRSIPAIS